MNSSNQLIDTFGRKHDYLRVSLTERCNLRCFYCMPEEGIELRDKKEFMTYEEVASIAKTFVDLGVKKIRLTGGEPLIRKDAHKIIEKLSELPIELAITTNGIIVDRFIDLFKRTGVKNINFSLDTLDIAKQVFITKRDFGERIMKNLDALLLEGFEVKVNVVLMRGVNDNEIIDFIDKTKHWKASIRFIEFMPFDGNNWDVSKCVSHDEVLERVAKHYGQSNVEPMKRELHQTARNYRIKGFAGSFGLISTVSKPFCSDCNRLRLTANGRMKNCLFSATESDLLGAFRKGEDIVPIIMDNVLQKKQMRGGMATQEEFEATQKNRSMILIGG